MSEISAENHFELELEGDLSPPVEDSADGEALDDSAHDDTAQQDAEAIRTDETATEPGTKPAETENNDEQPAEPSPPE